MRSEALRRELAMIELEEEFAAAKESGDVTPKLKADLREARRAYREMREGAPAGPGEARAQTVSGKGGVKGGGA